MANIRRLKKDVDYICGDFIADCLYYLDTYPDTKREDTEVLIASTLSLRNQIINKINHPEGKPKSKEIKAYFKCIEKDFGYQLDSLYTKFNELIQA